MAVQHHPGRVMGRADTAAGATFAGLTLLTHTANFAFIVVGGRLLQPGEFGNLTAILGVVLIGMAPGMAMQSLAAAGTLGGPVTIGRRLAWRLAGFIAIVVAVVMVGVSIMLDLGGPAIGVTIAVAAAAIPLTAEREGLLQGHGRFVALGTVMALGAGIKLTLGATGMWRWPTLTVAALAIAAGYVAQAAASAVRARKLAPSSTPARPSAAVVYAIVLMAALLVLMHLDALIAPAILPELEAGRYAVGVTASRISFWLPQFLVLLLFPHLVRDPSRERVIGIVVGLALLGLLVGTGAWLLGPAFAQLAFGSELATVGPELWRWAWLGVTVLGMQFLALIDLATGERRALGLLLAAVAAIAVWVPLNDPAGAVSVVTDVAVILTVTVALGISLQVARHRNPADPA